MSIQNYIEKVKNLKSPIFQQIRKIAYNDISHLSEEESKELYDRLNRGVNLLGTHEEMCKYLWSFGNMHEAKIHDAIKCLPIELFEQDFEVVDWGCGQGLATTCFFDYLKSNDDKFDLIILSHILEHLDDYLYALQEEGVTSFYIHEKGRILKNIFRDLSIKSFKDITVEKMDFYLKIK